MTSGAVPPVLHERLPFGVDPETVFVALFADESHAFWLDAGIRPEGGPGRAVSYLGAASASRPSVLVSGGDVFTVLDGRQAPATAELAELIREPWRPAVGAEHGPWPETMRDASLDASPGVSRESPHRPSREEMTGSPLGWYGWFGYEYGARALGAPAYASMFPDAALISADRVIEHDALSGRSTLWFLDEPAGHRWARATRERLQRLATLGSTMGSVTGSTTHGSTTHGSATSGWATMHGRASAARASAPRSEARWRHSDERYLRLIERCQRSIAAGDAYQLCLTNTVTVSTDAAPLDVYRRLRRESPAPHAGYLRFGDVALASSSPELFLSVVDGMAVTSPVKGTAPRHHDAAADAAIKVALGSDEKERAENLMIVDLMRNDLSRVATLGGVTVTRLLETETHRHVHQLFSTVEARLADGLDALDVLAACFPAGSMTGAPKLRAMGILHDLEKGPRGVYSGCFGRLGLDGSAELAMVIRSIVMANGEAVIGTGGGITALSVPERELAETKLKARALLSVLGL